MKKILIDKTLLIGIDKGAGILQRADVKVFTAQTSDELLSLHREERMNLIISRLDVVGMPIERLCAEVRKDESLRAVSLILFCHNRPDEKARAERCHPNEIMSMPVNSSLLLEKALSLLNISLRESYRVLLSVSIDGNVKEKPFFCRSENISVTGLLIETDRSFVPGDRVTCSFFLPGAKQIVVSGEIVRMINQEKNAGMKKFGIKFTRISPGDVNAIDLFVKNKAGHLKLH